MNDPIEILVTEVTDMKNDRVCVAGWSMQMGRMIRPLSAPHEHWPSRFATPELFEVGNRLQIRPSAVPGGRALPHAREDTVLAALPTAVGRVAPPQLPSALAASESASVAGLFSGLVSEHRFVPTGSNCPSLGTVSLDTRRMGFDERLKEGGVVQLRSWFYDADDERYNLPVVGRAIHAQHLAGGLAALHTIQAGHRRAHARVGLAHPLPDGRAFLMVNHVLFH